MSPFLLNIVLAIVWVALTEEYTPANFVGGFVVSFIALAVSQRAIGGSNYFKKVPQVIRFVLFFLRELLVANLRVAYEVISPGLRSRPGIIAIPLDVRTDFEITLLANLITLTPGTLSLDISPDRRVLYVHTMYADDVKKFRDSIKKGFEKRVEELLR